jgi:predicted dehydrogenase
VRHAIVGAGFGVAAHLPAFAAIPGVQVVALADSGSGRAARFATGALAAYSDWRRMLDEVRPDTLSVAVPPNFQREVVAAALNRGIHVLCEKPLGVSAEDAEFIVELAKVTERRVAVTYQFRFEPGLATLRDEVRSGRIGAIRRIDFAWITAGRADPSRPWSWQHDASQGGGVLNAFMPHVIDLISWLSGSRITRVMGRTAVLVPRRPVGGGEHREVTAEDLVDALLELDDGALVNIRVTNCQRGGEGMHIQFHGENGILRFTHRPPFDGPASVDYCWQDGNFEPAVVAAHGESGADTRMLPLSRLASLFVAAAQGRGCEQLPLCADAVQVQRVIASLRVSSTVRQFQDV